MLVGERMSYPVITVRPDMPIQEALNLMKREHVRRLPVVDTNGKMVGIVSEKDLLNASPSDVTTLSVWELTYLLSKITVERVMTRKVLTVSVDTPMEEAARIMADNKIGSLPVLRDGEVVGIITETTLFKIFLELLGAREAGVRVSVEIENQPGKLHELTHAIADLGGNFVAFGTFMGDSPSTSLIAFKVSNLDAATIEKAIQPYIIRIKDIRETAAA